ncbi:MAG: 2-amino-4-hydroxy-6-hydroxymethyldihydropteridine diphosphokinase [Gammaproteobacteria bacterium]|nr:MAG: 2-amino-4-hydroxy-6-hydroxymethyldihydropteridine diphosphokinase [Gammaproteobacteria bacterium]
MITTYIGVGSNLSDPIKQVKLAIDALHKVKNSQVSAISSIYGSKPMGPQDQPDYINAVVELKTSLKPLMLLDALQAIENKAGRVRKENRWGARILDLDILLFGDQIIENKCLTIPHYGMKVREFVLLPLQEVAPHLHLPNGESINDLADKIAHNNLLKLPN